MLEGIVQGGEFCARLAWPRSGRAVQRHDKGATVPVRIVFTEPEMNGFSERELPRKFDEIREYPSSSSRTNTRRVSTSRFSTPCMWTSDWRE